MNKNILDNDVQKFISKNLDIDIFQLILKKPVFSKVSNKEIAVQINSKLKSKKKTSKLVYYNKYILPKQS